MTELCFELLSKVVSTGSRDQLQLLLHFVDEEYLLNDDNEAGRTCLLRLLYQAVTKGNVATTELLIENRASIDTLDRGKSPLKAAIEHGHIEVLKLLVTRGADVKNTIIPVIQSSMERKVSFNWNKLIVLFRGSFLCLYLFITATTIDQKKKKRIILILYIQR